MGERAGIVGDPIEHLTKHIAQQGLRMTKQRKIIAEVLLASEEHLNIDELHHRVRKIDSQVGYATIYRTLKLLTECGLAVEAHFGDGAARYESGLHRGHHDHMICTSCGTILEFENEEIEALQLLVCKKNNFHMTHHKMEIYGLCSSCFAKSKD